MKVVTQQAHWPYFAGGFGILRFGEGSFSNWVAAWTQRKHLLSSETPLGGKLNRRWSVVIRKGLEVISHSLPKPVQLVQADALSQAFNVSIFKSALTL